jgi:hypothetical protein
MLAVPIDLDCPSFRLRAVDEDGEDGAAGGVDCKRVAIVRNGARAQDPPELVSLGVEPQQHVGAFGLAEHVGAAGSVGGDGACSVIVGGVLTDRPELVAVGVVFQDEDVVDVFAGRFGPGHVDTARGIHDHGHGKVVSMAKAIVASCPKLIAFSVVLHRGDVGAKCFRAALRLAGHVDIAGPVHRQRDGVVPAGGEAIVACEPLTTARGVVFQGDEVALEAVA